MSINNHTALLIAVQDARQAAARSDADWNDRVLAAYDLATDLGADDIAEALGSIFGTTQEAVRDLALIEEALACPKEGQ